MDAYPYQTITALSPRRSGAQALYAGLLTPHFGHFLLEGTSRLWLALRDGFQGTIVFDSHDARHLELPYVKRFLSLTGLWDRTIVATGPLQFEKVYVPYPAFRLATEIHPEFLRPFARAFSSLNVQARANRLRPLYLSRSKLSGGVIIGETTLEQSLEKEGFRIIYPELLPLKRQIILAAEANLVAGIQGSALHNVLFAPEPKRMLHLCREGRIRNFVMIDQVMGNEAQYVMGIAREIRPVFNAATPHLLDVERAFDVLEELGILRRKHRPAVDAKALMSDYLSEWEKQWAMHEKRQQRRAQS
ncbi:MAG: glycosyltransferase family 61 protein [Alphaproteobacteria bacterium]|nr:glycosyltransferase family 61 protein [Alphaproteobacteria bacterium]